ncbi:hypothetical protein [Amycolatopsis sp. NPDC004169]|uniref:hypothetical protein n=1 Tax=Amycolatopsis sp. NPDC004169 TaxID=3154453 RepID=UPI0033BCACCD
MASLAGFWSGVGRVLDLSGVTYRRSRIKSEDEIDKRVYEKFGDENEGRHEYHNIGDLLQDVAAGKVKWAQSPPPELFDFPLRSPKDSLAALRLPSDYEVRFLDADNEWVTYEIHVKGNSGIMFSENSPFELTRHAEKFSEEEKKK